MPSISRLFGLGFLVCLSSVLGAAQAEYRNVIFVDGSRGHDDENCRNESDFSVPCRTLNFALEGVRKRGNSTMVILAAGKYDLYPERNSTTFEGMQDIALVGNGTPTLPPSDQTKAEFAIQVTCLTGAGLTFLKVSGIHIENITFSECGALHVSTSRDFANDSFSFLEFQAGFYFLFCDNVSYSRVTITQSNGTGMVMYATVGRNSFEYCNFSLNTVNDRSIAGGGGLYIEFPYCIPGDLTCASGQSKIPFEYTSNATYVFDHCIFERNHAQVNSIPNITFIPYVPHQRDHWAFGRGGGLSVFFKGNAENISIIVNNTVVCYNDALWGGGVFVEFQDESLYNSFIMESSIIEQNTCYTSSLFNGTGGGGVRAGYIFYNASRGHYNRMFFISTCFNNNMAYWGGGVSFYTSRETDTMVATNTLEFTSCSWQSNSARLGAAVDLVVWHPMTKGATVQVKFSDSLVCGNSVSVASILGSYVGIGAFFSDSIPIQFGGSMLFTENNGSALVITSSSVEMLDNSIASFARNVGRKGGAIYLLGHASIRLHDNTTMSFVNNTAIYEGGAIYFQSVSESNLISTENCFIQFNDITVAPWNWTSKFYFKGNTANRLSNSIYVTSLLQCIWGGAYGPSNGAHESFIEQVFCWGDAWDYNGRKCSSEIMTAPAQFTVTKTPYNMTAFPGVNTEIPVRVLDDYNRLVTGPQVFGVQSLTNSVWLNSVYISDYTLQVFGWPNSSADLYMETADPRVLYTLVSIDLLSCPPGFVYIAERSTCVCGKGYAGLVRCSQEELKAKLRVGGWMGILDSVNVIMAGNHPYSQGSLFVEYFDLPNETTALDQSICGSLHRTGALCADCLNGYSPAFTSPSFDCVPCSDTAAKYHWLYYILAKFLLPTIFFMLVIVFRINMTSGPAHAFIFFAQILLTKPNVKYIPIQELNSPFEFFQDFYVIIYGLATLNFFYPLIPPTCLSPEIDVLKLIVLEYVVAVYPLVLILLIYITVKLYESGIRPVVCFCRPIHRCFAHLRRSWDLQRSLADAFGTFVILSYTKFIFVSIYFLLPTSLYDDHGAIMQYVLYFRGSTLFLSRDHIPYFLLGLIFSFFILLLPLLLLVYPLRLLQNCLKLCCCKECVPGVRFTLLLNIFQGCFKDGTNGTRDCRYFAGLYLIFRIIIFVVIVATTPNWLLQFLVNQLLFMAGTLLFATVRPYSVDFYNNVDAIIFTILAAINTLSLYTNYLETLDTHDVWSLVLQYILIYCPLIYMVVYILHSKKKLIRKLCCCCCCRVSTMPERLTLLSNSGSSSATESANHEVDLADLSQRMHETLKYHPLNKSNRHADV